MPSDSEAIRNSCADDAGSRLYSPRVFDQPAQSSVSDELQPSLRGCLWQLRGDVLCRRLWFSRQQLAPDTYAHFEAYAEATVEGTVLDTVSTTFDGVVEHCELKPGASFSYACPAGGDAVSRASCRSKNHSLTLTRR